GWSGEAAGPPSARTGESISSVAPDCLQRERRHAHRDVLGAARFRSAVANPPPGMCHDRLSGAHHERAAFVLHAQGAVQDDGNLLEVGPLPRLLPTGWRDHARDTDRGMSGVDSPGKLFDPLRQIAGSLDNSRLRNVCRNDLLPGRAYHAACESLASP